MNTLFLFANLILKEKLSLLFRNNKNFILWMINFKLFISLLSNFDFYPSLQILCHKFFFGIAEPILDITVYGMTLPYL